jgi:hypothetical protein
VRTVNLEIVQAALRQKVGRLQEGHAILSEDALPGRVGVRRGALLRHDARDVGKAVDQLRLLQQRAAQRGGRRGLHIRPQAAVQHRAHLHPLARQAGSHVIHVHHRAARARAAAAEQQPAACAQALVAQQVRDRSAHQRLPTELHAKRLRVAHPGVAAAVAHVREAGARPHGVLRGIAAEDAANFGARAPPVAAHLVRLVGCAPQAGVLAQAPVAWRGAGGPRQGACVRGSGGRGRRPAARRGARGAARGRESRREQRGAARAAGRRSQRGGGAPRRMRGARGAAGSRRARTASGSPAAGVFRAGRARGHPRASLQVHHPLVGVAAAAEVVRARRAVVAQRVLVACAQRRVSRRSSCGGGGGGARLPATRATATGRPRSSSAPAPARPPARSTARRPARRPQVQHAGTAWPAGGGRGARRRSGAAGAAQGAGVACAAGGGLEEAGALVAPQRAQAAPPQRVRSHCPRRERAPAQPRTAARRRAPRPRLTRAAPSAHPPPPRRPPPGAPRAGTAAAAWSAGAPPRAC